MSIMRSYWKCMFCYYMNEQQTKGRRRWWRRQRRSIWIDYNCDDKCKIIINIKFKLTRTSYYYYYYVVENAELSNRQWYLNAWHYKTYHQSFSILNFVNVWPNFRNCFLFYLRFHLNKWSNNKFYYNICLH